jgi:hypothetical protein
MARRDLPKETGEQQTEISPATEILESEGLSMGKEVKIGLGVIVALLLLFGGVLYYRLKGPPSDPVAKDEPSAAASEKTEAGSAAKKTASTTAATTPTVVTTTGSSDAGRTKLSVSEMAGWSGAADSTKTKAPASRPDTRDTSTLPNYMPSRTGAAGSNLTADPFQQRPPAPTGGRTTPVPSATTASSPAGMAYADAEVSASPLPQEPAGSVEIDSSSPNPLRGQSTASWGGSQGSTLTRGMSRGFGSSGSNSSTQITPISPSEQSASVPPAPTTGYESSYDPTSRSGYRSAHESPAYGSRFSSPSARTSGSDAGTSRWGNTSRGDGSMYNDGSSYGDRSASTRSSTGASSLLGTGSSSAAVAPQAASNEGKYEILPGDNYSVISQKVYGDGGYFKALAEHNRKKFPDEDRLRPGEEISTPDVAALEKDYPGLCPKAAHREANQRHLSMASTSTRLGGRIYVVQDGDTLFDIAKYELGKAARWSEIYELNREAIGRDFDHLSPGMRLTLPSDRPTGKVTQRPDDHFQR